MPRSKKGTTAKHKSAVRKMRAKVKDEERVTTKSAKLENTKIPSQPQQKSAGSNRTEGIRLFKLAGRPTKEQFILVYGERGPKMTWDQRAAAGVPAEKFQAALAEKAPSRRAATK